MDELTAVASKKRDKEKEEEEVDDEDDRAENAKIAKKCSKMTPYPTSWEDLAVETFYTEYKENKLKVPHYQRGYVWPLAIADRFINSIFYAPEIIPPLFLHKITGSGRRKTVRNIVDGCQRLLSVFKYKENKFPWSTYNTKGEEVQWFYQDLTEEMKEKFDSFKFKFCVFLDWSENRVSMAFQCLNSGVALSASEKLRANDSSLAVAIRQDERAGRLVKLLSAQCKSLKENSKDDELWISRLVLLFHGQWLGSVGPAPKVTLRMKNLTLSRAEYEKIFVGFELLSIAIEKKVWFCNRHELLSLAHYVYKFMMADGPPRGAPLVHGDDKEQYMRDLGSFYHGCFSEGLALPVERRRKCVVDYYSTIFVDQSSPKTATVKGADKAEHIKARSEIIAEGFVKYLKNIEAAISSGPNPNPKEKTGVSTSPPSKRPAPAEDLEDKRQWTNTPSTEGRILRVPAKKSKSKK